MKKVFIIIIILLLSVISLQIGAKQNNKISYALKNKQLDICVAYVIDDVSLCKNFINTY